MITTYPAGVTAATPGEDTSAFVAAGDLDGVSPRLPATGYCFNLGLAAGVAHKPVNVEDVVRIVQASVALQPNAQ
jgi:hypothetical protein